MDGQGNFRSVDGSSDTFSGVTANPAVGYCADLLVRTGVTVLFLGNLLVFTTDLGTPYGLAACPVIKVATRWHDLMGVWIHRPPMPKAATPPHHYRTKRTS